MTRKPMTLTHSIGSYISACAFVVKSAMAQLGCASGEFFSAKKTTMDMSALPLRKTVIAFMDGASSPHLEEQALVMGAVVLRPQDVSTDCARTVPDILVVSGESLPAGCYGNVRMQKLSSLSPNMIILRMSQDCYTQCATSLEMIIPPRPTRRQCKAILNQVADLLLYCKIVDSTAAQTQSPLFGRQVARQTKLFT